MFTFMGVIAAWAHVNGAHNGLWAVWIPGGLVFGGVVSYNILKDRQTEAANP